MSVSSDPKIKIAVKIFSGCACGSEKRVWQSFILITFILLMSGVFTEIRAQVTEDSTQTERPVPELPRTGTYNNFLRTPYQSSFHEADINRYSLYGVDGKYTFHQRLRFSTVEDFMMGEEEKHHPYGVEWENGINMRLAAILRETFKEQNSFLQKLARIVPFLGLGFFEEYEVPIVPRQEYFNPEPQIPEN